MSRHGKTWGMNIGLACVTNGIVISGGSEPCVIKSSYCSVGMRYMRIYSEGGGIMVLRSQELR